MNSSVSPSRGQRPGHPFWWLTAILVVVLGFLFASSFKSNQALFSNDGPVGAQMAAHFSMPEALFGIWVDLGWIGMYSGNFSPHFSSFLLGTIGPMGFNKFSVPLSMLVLGLCAAAFFRQIGFRGWVCVLGGIAAALNSNFFSNGGWGLPSRALCLAATFLALTAIQGSFKRHSVIKLLLAGLAVGISITEAGDNGAIFSLFVAAFAFFASLVREESPALRVAKGVGRVTIVALFAALLAAQTLNVFVGTAVKGIAGAQQDDRTKEQQWDWATQWSLPKIETLRVVIPGLFGYRMDGDHGSQYWGWVGQQPGWEQHHQGFPRYSGAGEYAGILVVLVAWWAFVRSLSRGSNPFSITEQRMIWFWSAMGLVTLLLSWGRFAPLYQIIYHLPYFSTIRNPMKFMHPFHMIVMILFAYGLEGMAQYMDKAAAGSASLFGQLKAWWAKASPSDRRWTYGCAAALGASVLGWLVFISSRKDVVKYLSNSGFETSQAQDIMGFATGEIGLFIVFFTALILAVMLVQSGLFAGPRTRWAAVMLGLLLVVDLSRANAPWIKFYDWREKYASNPILDVLRQRPYEGRVTMPRFQAGREFALFQQVYQVEWLQHQFQFYNIQSLDLAQEPRMPADKIAYLKAVGANPARLWELTNTKFIGGMAGQFVDALNQQLDPQKKRFRLHTAFEFFQKPGTEVIGVRTNEAGPYSLIEFTGALPRAKLYSQWQVITNEEATLARLSDAAFDPAELVIVNEALASAPAATNATLAPVEFVKYSPKRVELRAKADVPTMLLLNDKWDPGWHVSVDGKPATMLRANYLMRSVALPAGEHTVVFHFQQTSSVFYLSLGAVVLGLLLCGYLLVTERIIPSRSAATK